MLLCSLWSSLSAVRNPHLRKASRPESALPVLPSGDDSLWPWMLEGAQLPKGEVTCHVLAQKVPCCLHCSPFSASCFGNALVDQRRPSQLHLLKVHGLDLMILRVSSNLVILSILSILSVLCSFLIFAAGIITFPLVVSRHHKGFTNAFINSD